MAVDSGPMVIVWRYRVADDRAPAFERAYGPDGDWARLFARAAGYLGTELVRGEVAGEWMTIDRWASRSHWEAFMIEHGEDYERLDAALAALTESQEFVLQGTAAVATRGGDLRLRRPTLYPLSYRRADRDHTR